MLEINGLVKHYGDFTLNCTMKVGPGRITGLVGENGAVCRPHAAADISALKGRTR